VVLLEGWFEGLSTIGLRFYLISTIKSDIV